VADTFQLRLLTPERSLFEGPVEAVIVPGENGQLGVLAGHTKLVTTLVPGVVRYVASGQTHQVAASGGFAEVSPGGVTILADTAEPPQEIDRQRAERSRQEALQALAKRAELDEKEVSRLEARLARALNRLKVADSAR